MAKSVEQIRKQIAKLQEQERVALKKEAAGVIAKIKVAVEHYGLTPEDIFGSGGVGRPTSRLAGASRKSGVKRGKTSQRKGNGVSLDGATAKRASPAKGIKVAPKFKDDAGNTWSGRGSRPRWLRAAIEGGKKLEDFTVA